MNTARRKFELFIIVLMGSFKLYSQNNEWIANNFSNSVSGGITEINDRIYASVMNVITYDSLYNYKLTMYNLDFGGIGGQEINLHEDRTVIFDDHYSTQAMKYISQTGLWILFQVKLLSQGFYNYRVILCDTTFSILSEKSVDAYGYPLTFHFDSDDDETYLLGSLLGPPHAELVFLKYVHAKPLELSQLVVKQAQPQNLLFVSSMTIDPRTSNMLVFSYSGISILDTNLYEVHYYDSSQVLTSDHGDVIAIGDYYYSHGARDSSFEVPLRKLVIHKYDSEFNILKSDTLGWPKWDNYPFSKKSIDFRNHQIIVGGLLDGPLIHSELAESVKKYYLAKYDEDINQVWYKEYGGDRAYLFYGIHLLEDGSCLAYGTITDTITKIHYGYIIHVDENGDILSSYTSPQGSKTPLKIVNPGNDHLQILNPENTQFDIRLYDLNGINLLNSRIEPGATEISTSNLASGIYPYVIFQNGIFISSGKWLKTN